MLLNGKDILLPEQLQQVENTELREFLCEWFNERPYVVGHTSGSTGMPKEIRLSKAGMRASARITNEFLGLGSRSVLLLCLSVSYIAGKMMVVRALEAGASLVTVAVCSRPLRELEEGRNIDLAAMVPMQVEESMKHPEEKARFGGIRRLLIGGAAASPLLEKQLRDIPTVCYATYGMTETFSHVALRNMKEETVYSALKGVTFAVDKRGCLVVEAPHLHAGRLVTNDLVRLDDNRHFEWLGRYDHVINSGGIKFFPEAIERKISFGLPRRFFIASRPDERLGERIVLVLEGLPASAEEERQWTEELKQVLTPYEMPREFIYLTRFYETSTGKVIRRME